MDFAPIRKQPSAETVAPNLDDYVRVCAAFTWSGARGELAGLSGGGLNIAHEAVERHARGSRRDRVALRWRGKRGQVHDYTWARLAELTSRFASALDSLGVGRGGHSGTWCSELGPGASAPPSSPTRRSP